LIGVNQRQHDRHQSAQSAISMIDANPAQNPAPISASQHLIQRQSAPFQRHSAQSAQSSANPKRQSARQSAQSAPIGTVSAVAPEQAQ
jgi:hypothetical protein